MARLSDWMGAMAGLEGAWPDWPPESATASGIVNEGVANKNVKNQTPRGGIQLL